MLKQNIFSNHRREKADSSDLNNKNKVIGFGKNNVTIYIISMTRVIFLS